VAEVVGTWVSEVRQTGYGPMRFTFSLGEDGSLGVVGTSVDASGGEEFRRSGTYHLRGDELSSAVLNGGRPVRVALTDRRLAVTIDETLAFRLWRQ
jgi:hypothetical protein